MTKLDLVDCIHSATNMHRRESADVLETVFALMKDTLVAGDKIKIAGFGNFEVKSKAARKGRNPISGESIIIEARKVLSFKPSIVLKKSINQ